MALHPTSAEGRRDVEGDLRRLLDRVPPHSIEAERAVLASLLLDPNLCDDVAPIVHVQDFYADPHRVLFRHLYEMQAAGERIDVTLLRERLSRANELETIGGITFLAELFEADPVAAHATYYARIIHEKATLRALIHAATEIQQSAFDHQRDAAELLNAAEEKVLAIRDVGDSSEVHSMHDVLLEALDRIDARLDHESDPTGVETGFADLDSLTGGFHNAELIILAARPSMGKTALATNIAEKVALKQRVPTLFVSLEMSRLELAERMLCSFKHINSHKLRNGFISDADRRRLVEGCNELSQAPLFIDDTPSRSLVEIAAAARRLKRKHELGLIVIDYLQLIEPDNDFSGREQQVAKIARRLKGMARELSVPVLCLAQVNRQAEQSRDDHRPKLSQLRESGAIEQDADVVMFVHREGYYHRQDSDEDQRDNLETQAELIVAKQRNGPTGTVKLVWLKEYTRFEDETIREYQEELV